ncbi:MAG: LysR substrate-binding domain-containing protein, partial [Methylophaga sp.]
VANEHPLADKSYVDAEDLADSLLLTFPVAPERLDVFSQFLQPAGILPASKQIQSMEIMLQMVILNRGVTVLPDWLAREIAAQEAVIICRLGSDGLPKTLFAAIREADADIDYIQEFIGLSRRHQL